MIFGTYNGPSYGTFDYRDSLEAFSSERIAWLSLKIRYQGYSDVVRRVVFDADGHATIKVEEYVQIPATTREDYIDLYHGVKDGFWVATRDGKAVTEQLWIIDDQPYARLYFGPRGGVRKENF